MLRVCSLLSVSSGSGFWNGCPELGEPGRERCERREIDETVAYFALGALAGQGKSWYYHSAFFLTWLWFVKCENLTKAAKAGFPSFPFCALFNLWFPHGSDGNCFWSVQGTYVQSITFSKVSKPSWFVSSWMWKWVTLIRVLTTNVFRRQILFQSLKKIQTWLIRQHIFKGTYLLRTRTLVRYTVYSKWHSPLPTFHEKLEW